MGLFKEKGKRKETELQRMDRVYFKEDRKLYTKFLKKLGLTDIKDKSRAEQLLHNYFAENGILPMTIEYDSETRQLALSSSKFEIAELKQKRILLSTYSFMEYMNKMKDLHYDYLEKTEAIIYYNDKANEMKYMEVVSPYTTVETKVDYIMDVEKTTIKLLSNKNKNDMIEITGVAKAVEEKIMSVRECDAEFGEKKLSSNTYEKDIHIVIHNIYRNDKGRRFDKVISKDAMFIPEPRKQC